MPISYKNIFVSTIKLLGWIVSLAFLLFLVVVILIRSPKVQQLITATATDYLSDKTKTRIDIAKCYLGFDGNLILESVFVAEPAGDTLLYSQRLEVSVALVPLIMGEVIDVKYIHWQGLKANVVRSAANETFNFSFLLDAFASKNEGKMKENDAPSKPYEFIVGEVILHDIQLAYNDELLGMRTSMDLKMLDLEIQALDLEAANYALDALTIDGLKLKYLQYGELPNSAVDTTSSTGKLPKFTVENLTLQNMEAEYESKPDSLLVDAFIEYFQLSLPNADLENQQVAIEQLILNGINFQVESLATSEAPKGNSNPSVFSWPTWEVYVKNIQLTDNHYQIKTSLEKPEKGVFSPSFLDFVAVNVSLTNVSYQKEQMVLNIADISFKERSGFALNHLSAKLKIDNTKTIAQELSIKTSHNSLEGNFDVGYKSVSDLISKPMNSQFNVDLAHFDLSAKDANYFEPSFENSEVVRAINTKKLKGNVRISGNSTRISLDKMNLLWGNSSLNAKGQAKNWLDGDKLTYTLAEFNINTTKTDVALFSSDLKDASYMPSEMKLSGDLEGNKNQLNTRMNLASTLGNAHSTLALDMKETLSFKWDLALQEVLLGEVLSDPCFDTLSMKLAIEASGQEISTIVGTFKTSFQKLAYCNYDLAPLTLEGNMENGKLSTFLSYADSSLNAKLHASITLDSLTPKANLELDVIGAALQDLGLSNRDIRAAFKVKTNMEGTANAFDATFEISDALAVYDYKSYNLGVFEGQAYVRQDSTNVNLNSEIMDFSMIANADPQGLIYSLTNKFQRYLDKELSRDTTNKDVQMRMNLVVRENPLLDKVFLTQLNAFDSMSLNMAYDQVKDSLLVQFSAPFIDFQGNTLDSLNFHFLSHSSNADFMFGWNKIEAGPITIERTVFDGQIAQDALIIDFLVNEKEEKLFHIRSIMTLKGDTLIYHLDPDDFILDKQAWQVPPNNRVAISDNFIDFENIDFEKGSQKIHVLSSQNPSGQDQLSVLFEHFDLTTVTTFFSNEVDLVNGIISGDFNLIDPFGSVGLESDVIVSDFSILEKNLGLLTLMGKSVSSAEYDFDLSLKEGPLVFGFAGSYTAFESGPVFDLGLNLEKLDTELVEEFALGELTNAKGYFSGEMSFSGTIEEPRYQGALVFNEVGVSVSALNTAFSFPTESIGIDNRGLHFDNFTIVDVQKNTFRFDGDILTENPVNPTFNLDLKANNFTAVNAQKGDNDLFFGKVILNADLTIDGSFNLPKVRGDFKVKEGSNLTIIVPESQLGLVEREGIVVFVNKDQPDKIITRVSKGATNAEVTGIDLYTNMVVEDNSVFRVLIDEQTGDNFEVSGRGDFTVGIDPTGRTTLAGRYKVSSGHYRASLYGLAKRQFSISPESLITWSGDPMDAKLNVAAVYDVKTSAGPIMATSMSTASMDVVKLYSVPLPFQVILHINGQLLQPQLSFALNMGEASRSALGGGIYSRLQQVNQQETELNKQVFSLLLLNRFFPASGSDGSAGGAEAIARSNVSKVLSGQLNAFSEKLLGKSGFDLNFGLNSYSAEQSVSGSSGTQLDVTASKTLLDDRLVVQVGSEVGIEGSGQTSQSGSPLIGNVSLEYRLSDNGRYRLKGFRQNEFENVIEGQLIVTGIALIFNREFDRIRDLFEKTGQELDVQETKSGN
ncbi:MAG: translocation and assembly module TamB [Cyclobacteriaceae bacterium]|jgi:hypothetical protein